MKYDCILNYISAWQFWKVVVESDGQQYHKYQQMKQQPPTSNQIIDDHNMWRWKSKA